MTHGWRRAVAGRPAGARSALKLNNFFSSYPALCALFHIRLTSLPVCCFGCDKSLALSPSAHWVGPANDQLPMQQCGKRWVIAGGELARACCACDVGGLADGMVRSPECQGHPMKRAC